MATISFRISLLAGIAAFSVVVLGGLMSGGAPLPLLGRACSAGLFAALVVCASASIARSVLQECLAAQDQNENNGEDDNKP